MTPEQHRRISELYHHALELPPERRAAFLDDTCVDDPVVRADVESLLMAHREAGDFIDAPAIAVAAMDLAADQRPVVPPDTIGPYQVQYLLGRGGMGEVYRAHDPRLGRDVALKMLPERSALDAQHLARFEREARLLAKLNHPNIAALYGIEEFSGHRALVLELVEGPTLDDRLTAGPLAVPEVLGIARQIAGALDTAHQRGIVHRDLKPSNISVRPDGTVKVLDFGLAKALDLPDGRDTVPVSITSEDNAQTVLGTAPYMSPEQARGIGVDQRTDIWAFGCVLYETLTGRRAFDGETRSDVIAAVLARTPDWTALPAETPPMVRRVLMRCLEKDPRRRLRSAGDVLSDLEDPGIAADEQSLAARSAARRSLLAASAAAVLIVASGIGITSLWLSTRGLTPPGDEASVPTLRRLTVELDSYADPAVSADGRTIAYASIRTGTSEIRTAGFAPGSLELPITTDGGGNVQPAFSPDGQWLAYHSRKRGGVWVVPATGGAARQVADFGSMPSWSPDSSRIVFTSDAGGMSSQAVLWVAGRDGRAPVQLTRLGSPPGGHVAPAWSHDGHRIVFSVGKAVRREIWTVDSNGHDPRRVATGAATAPPRFSPGGRSVYWIGSTAEGNDCLTRVALSRSGEAVGEPEVVLAFPGHSGGGFAIARDGTAIVSLNHTTSNLFAVALDEGGSRDPIQLTHDDAQNTYPAFGPTGRLTYQQEVAGRPVTLWLMDEDGRNKEPLSAGLSASVGIPQWDPHGTRALAVVTGSPPGQTYLAWIDIATRRLIRAADAPRGGPPSLSPDGRTIALHFIDPEGVMNVWTQRLDDGSRRQVTFDREAMAFPRWSPDGKWLAVTIKRGDRTHVGIVQAEGGEVEQLTFDRGQSWPYSFSPDNEQVAFGGEREGVWNIYAVSRRTKRVSRLTHFATGNGHARFPAWSPRGNRIVFVRAEWTASLWTVKLPS